MSIPNPVGNIANVQVYTAKAGKSTVLITDAAGKLVYYGSKTLLAGTNSFGVDISQQASGLYLLQVKDEYGIIM